MRCKFIYIALLTIIGFSARAQQDPLYNQYQFNQQMINPAYVGIYEMMSFNFISRFQWVDLEGAPVTQTLTGSTSFWNGRSGAGLSLIYDQFGVTNNYEVQAAYSYIIPFQNFKLSMGVQGGIMRFENDYDELNLDFPDDPLLNPPIENFTEPNFGVGFMAMSEFYFVGLSVPRILNINVQDGDLESNRYQQHYYLSGGAVLAPSPFFKLKFTGLVRYVQNAPISFDLFGSVLLSETIWLGLSLRNLNTAGIFTLIEIGDSFRAGYSFEIPISNDLTSLQYTTHEVSLGLDFSFLRRQLLKRRYF